MYEMTVAPYRQTDTESVTRVDDAHPGAPLRSSPVEPVTRVDEEHKLTLRATVTLDAPRVKLIVSSADRWKGTVGKYQVSPPLGTVVHPKGEQFCSDTHCFCFSQRTAIVAVERG